MSSGCVAEGEKLRCSFLCVTALKLSPQVNNIDEVGTLHLSDGTEITGAKEIVFGTGFVQQHPFLPDEIQERLDVREDGLYLHRHILHPDVPRLAWVGANVSTLSNPLTHSLQAMWLANVLKGTYELPSRTVMQDDIERLRTWKEEQLPLRSDRGATIMLHQLHYHEELLADLRISPFLKKGCCLQRLFYEVAQPYLPVDYTTVVQQQAGHDQGYYKAIPRHHEMRGHEEGNGYVVIIYLLCFLAAFLSCLIAAIMFLNLLINYSDTYMVARILLVLGICGIAGVLGLLVMVLAVLLRRPHERVNASLDVEPILTAVKCKDSNHNSSPSIDKSGLGLDSI